MLQIDGFVAVPTSGTEEVIRRWDRPLPRDRDPAALFTLLGAHMIPLLRVDPVLPERYLGEDWPARRSAAVHRAVSTSSEARAEASFADLVEDARVRR